MFVDASAIVAIMLAEEDGERLLADLPMDGTSITSPIALYEATLAIARKSNASVIVALEEVKKFLDKAAVEIVPIETEHGDLALETYSAFGKGRHPAALNMGDCFAYAVAKKGNKKILFTGDDFTKTDLGYLGTIQ